MSKMRSLALICGIALAAALIVFVLALWLRFAAAWSAGQAPDWQGEEPVERCGTRVLRV